MRSRLVLSQCRGVLVITIACLWAWPVSVPAASPLAPVFHEPEAYSETLTIVLDLEGDTLAQIWLSVSNLGWGDQNCSCRILVVDAKGPWTKLSYYNKQEWFFRPPHRLQIGPCYAAATADAVEIYASLEGGTLRARLGAPLALTEPPGHRIENDDGFFEQRVLVRWAPARAELTLPGRPSRPLSGHGSLDHFRVTFWPNELGEGWIRVYGLGPAGAFLLMGRFPPGQTAAEGWIWRPKDRVPLALSGLRLKRAKEGRVVEATVAGETYRARIQKTLFRHAPVEDLGAAGYVAGAFMGNPVTRTYRALLLGPEDTLPPVVYVEITDADE